LLIVSLPTSSATARMRIWRALKALGCGGAARWALPAAFQRRRPSRPCAILPKSAPVKGQCLLMRCNRRSADEADAYRQLFDRSHDYAQQRKAWKDATAAWPHSRRPNCPRLLFEAATRVRRGGAFIFSRARPGIEPMPHGSTSASAFRPLARTAARREGPHPRLDTGKYQGARAKKNGRRLWVEPRGQRLADPPFSSIAGALPVAWPSPRSARRVRSIDFDDAAFTQSAIG